MIYEFPNTLDNNQCKHVIDYFESHNKTKRDNELFKFDEVLIEDQSLSISLFNIVNDKFNEFQDKFPEYIFPAQYNFENIRIKKYEVGDKFDWHVDVGDYASAKRFLIGMIYLNDNFEGGHTDFKLSKDEILSVKPVEGKMVFFTPFWDNPHRGSVIESGFKYIINIYFHYV